MDTFKLKEIQAPLKELYKQDPQKALVTLKATSSVGEGITCKVETGKAMTEAGLHPATGGNGLSVCSGDMLLEALTACAGVTLKAVATSIEFDLKDAKIHAEGDLDFRGTLSVDKEAPVGFKNIRLKFELDTNESQEKIDTLIKLTERFCVVYQTLNTGNKIETDVLKK
ncbi:MAG: OsmC family protein [Gracilimonas sp.]